MPQGRVPLLPFLLALVGYAMAGLTLWPSLHVALSNASVFVDYSADHNDSATPDLNATLSLVDTVTNATVLTRVLPSNLAEGRLEFDCSCFLYAGTFRFLLEHRNYATAVVSSGTDTGVGTHRFARWWSTELQVHWPTFHIAVERASNQSGSFQVGISTNELFKSCSSGLGSTLFLEVSYLEYNQIGRKAIDKVRVRTRHPIETPRAQTVELACAFPFMERDFIRVALRSPHSSQDVKSSGPLYLSRIFSYKLLVDNVPSFRTGCEGAVSVRLVAPPCAHVNGKIQLYRDSGGAGSPGLGAGLGGFLSEEPPWPPLAFNWLTQGENETEFNCSVFDPGRNKYCFRFVFNFSRSPSPAQTCLVVQRNAESWGPWQPWNVCSVSCGEGVRERIRECLLPSGGGGRQCTGMLKEQSLCSLEDCAVVPRPSPSLPPVGGTPLGGGNFVVVAGISLCLVVILATVLITVWRRLRLHGSTHSPGGRKLSDEASICGHSLQRPSLSDSQGPRGGLPMKPAQMERRSVGCPPLAQPPVLALPHDPERLSPSGQKVLPPIFGYRLAQHQLKEMKKKGLKEATQMYHVSQSPVDDTLLETTATPTQASTPTPAGCTSSGLGGSPAPLNLQEEGSLSRFRITAPFPEHRGPAQSYSRTLPDRLSSRTEVHPGPPVSGYGGGGSSKRNRTADWVEMVERSGFGGGGGGGGGVLPRTIPEGSCKTRGAWESQAFLTYSIPEQGPSDWATAKPRPPGDARRRPWVENSAPLLNGDLKHAGTNTAAVDATHRPGEAALAGEGERRRSGGGASGIGGPMGKPELHNGNHLGLDRAERAEQNWSRRGPSPIQRNILARKLKEAQSCGAAPGQRGRQRSSTFSVSTSEQRKGRCRSLPLSGDYSSGGGSPYGLSEAEQRMMDLDLSSSYMAE
ncbi:thrombospondin type-1 domain-containing protein 1 [Aplochiton taeniatus]